ncbi:MAG: type II toxin-antitoxin system RelE/ParE family toxin [Proteobacteria bacterium]|nr:type II toxin-antitoxin system RelE/ParE family toxin [Pseudomonadota bacterium]
MKIISFGNKETETFVKTGKIPKGCQWANIKKIALRKIDMIVFAKKLSDLKSPPNNKLEKLEKDLKNYWSIRINDQFRIIFKVNGNEIEKLQIVDYH